MNFYGHAHFAARLSADRGYALGSMLPDFEGMCGSRLLETTSESVRRGVALHHATDSVFHGAPTFLDQCSLGLVELVERGVRRATARACAHVGVELLFDSYLIDTFGEDAVYLESLDVGAPDALGAAMVFPDGGARFEALRRRLRDYGVPSAYRDPEFVADRLVNALSARPRLAMAEGERERVAGWLGDAKARILAAAPELARTVGDALNAPPMPERAAPAPRGVRRSPRDA